MKPRILGLALATTLLISVSPAFAADVPGPPPVEDLRPAAYDWTGFYAGGWLGAACIDGNLFDNTTGTKYLLAGCGNKFGVLGGGNYQVDNWVFGLEGDFGWGSNLAKNTDPTANFGFDMKYIGTVRGRAGWAIDRTLLFLTAGGAFAEGDLYGVNGAKKPPHIQNVQYGWTLGGGVEEAVTDNFHLRLDYLYTHLNKQDYKAGCCSLNVDWGGEQEVRLGAIWSFGTF